MIRLLSGWLVDLSSERANGAKTSAMNQVIRVRRRRRRRRSLDRTETETETDYDGAFALSVITCERLVACASAGVVLLHRTCESGQSPHLRILDWRRQPQRRHRCAQTYLCTGVCVCACVCHWRMHAPAEACRRASHQTCPGSCGRYVSAALSELPTTTTRSATNSAPTENRLRLSLCLHHKLERNML